MPIMKKRLLVWICFIAHQTFAQTEVPLPQKGFRQAIMHVGNFFDPPFDKSIRYVRDTIMCGYTYAMYCNEYRQNSSQIYSCESGKFDHFTRYDKGKVYYRYGGCSGSEELKYDFNLKLNDTFKIRVVWDDDLAVVDSIDIGYLYNNSPRKYIRLKSLSGFKDYEWIEGIGDINMGLFYESDFEGGHDQLTCYKEFNQTLYMNATDYNCDNLLKPLNVTIEKSLINEINIYINSQSQTLDIVSAKESLFNLQLLDATGRSILSETYSSKDKQIPVSNLSSGIYFLSLETPNHEKTIRKLVIN